MRELYECEGVPVLEPLEERPDEVRDGVGAICPSCEKLDDCLDVLQSLLYSCSLVYGQPISR